MILNELKESILEKVNETPNGFREWRGICRFLHDISSFYTINWRSCVELSANGKHLFVSHVHSPAIESYELLNLREYEMLKAIGVPKGNMVKTEKGIIFGVAA